MQHAQFRNPRAGGVGLGLVVAIHLVMGWALINGLVRPPTAVKQPPLQVKPLVPEDLREPEPPPPPRPLPKQQEIKPIFVPEPIVQIDYPQQQQQLTTTREAPPLAPSGPREPPGPTSVPQSGPGPTQVITSPTLVCTRMGKPELPAVNWTGEAVLKAVATVRGGRVVSADVKVISGSVDPRTRRALQAAVSSTLQDSYECPGNHLFEQEFLIRVD